MTHVCRRCQDDPTLDLADMLSQCSDAFVQWLQRSPSFHSVVKAWGGFYRE